MTTNIKGDSTIVGLLTCGIERLFMTLDYSFTDTSISSHLHTMIAKITTMTRVSQNMSQDGLCHILRDDVPRFPDFQDRSVSRLTEGWWWLWLARTRDNHLTRTVRSSWPRDCQDLSHQQSIPVPGSRLRTSAIPAVCWVGWWPRMTGRGRGLVWWESGPSPEYWSGPGRGRPDQGNHIRLHFFCGAVLFILL